MHFSPSQLPFPAFSRFGLHHGLGLLIVFLIGWLLQRVGRRHPRAVEALLGSWLLVYVLGAYQVRWGELSWATALPLHVCDLLLVLAFTMLVRPPQPGQARSLAFELLFFGAWGGSVWAFITPDLSEGFPHWRYFEFFFGHGLIFWLLAHFSANRGCRIPPKASLTAWKWLWGYTLVVGALDLAFGWNYGYLGHKPGAGSVLDLLGPWPIYIIVSIMGEGLVFYLLEKLVVRGLPPSSPPEAGLSAA